MSGQHDDIKALIQDFLISQLPEESVSSAWTVGESKSGGRGLFATRDIQPSERIFVDLPIIIGPRRSGGALCVGCHLGESEEGDRLVGCPRGCRLPVCGAECSLADRHQAECRKLSPGQQPPVSEQHWSPELFHSLAALRSLSLDTQQRNIIKALQANAAGQPCWEVESLRRELGARLTSDEDQWMRLCCRTMDTNAFETVQVPPHREKGDKGSCGTRGSLRGLYPLSSLMNHSCSPNTTHSYDDRCRMQVVAATPILAGEEISTSYVSQLWDTASRRHALAKTKQFACRCPRCKDPSEFGSMLSGLPCPEDQCQGLLLSKRPLDYRAPDWCCTKCGHEQSPNKILELQRRQGMLLASVDTSNPDAIIEFLAEGHVPESGIVAVQLKAGLNLSLGHLAGYKWSELTDEHLKIKEEICRDLLDLMDKLKTGYCRLKGLVVFDIHLTLCERLRRIELENRDQEDSIQSLKSEIIKTWELAKRILINDATAPAEFHEKLKKSDTAEIKC